MRGCAAHIRIMAFMKFSLTKPYMEKLNEHDPHPNAQPACQARSTGVIFQI